MQSSRLPGKVLADLAGRPLLEYVVCRLEAACGEGAELLVATSTAQADDAIEGFCCRQNVACFRGSEKDVLGRYVAATADLTDGDIVVRATADNPCYCPRRIAAIIAEHRQSEADYTCIENLSYVVPEVMNVVALRAMAKVAQADRFREHVTPFFREAEHLFRVVQLPNDWEGLRPDIRLTVDTAEELDRMAAVCRDVARQDPLFPLETVYEWFSTHRSRAV